MKTFLLTIMINVIAFGAFAGRKEISLTVAKYDHGVPTNSNFADEMKTETDLGYCISGIVDAKTNLTAENYDWDKYIISVLKDKNSGRLQIVMASPLVVQHMLYYSTNNFTGAYDSCKKIITNEIKNHLNKSAVSGSAIISDESTPRSSDIVVKVPQSGLK